MVAGRAARETSGVPTLTDGIVTLRRPRDDDLDALVIECQDPEIQRWTGVPSPYGPEHAAAYLARAAAEASEGRTAGFVAVDEHDLVIGSFSLMELDRALGYGEIGYWVAARARRTGLATRAVTLLRDWGAAALGLTLIELLAHEDNVPSQRVAELTGFVDTGERRTAPRTDDPGPARHLVYAWRPE
jgi:RimJ/RimL family protein N-acetyltransferase